LSSLCIFMQKNNRTTLGGTNIHQVYF
jgi:hypothetical protein